MAPPPSCILVMLLVVELPPSLQRCVHDQVQAQVPVVRTVDRPPSSPRKRSILGEKVPPRQPIRIQTWFRGSSDGQSGAEEGQLEAGVREAVQVVTSLLSVARVQGPLRLSRDVNKYCKFIWKNSSALNFNRCGRASSSYTVETCLDVTIPDGHLEGCYIYPEPDSPRRRAVRPEGAGLPDTDFLLYVLVQSTDKCRAEPDVLAYAAHCQVDPRGRPVAGMMVICRDALAGAAAVQTVIHELLHVLGFSKELFSTWRDCTTSSEDGAECSSRGKIVHADESGQMRIYTPSIISAMQRHLGSSDPGLGGPLENQGAPPGRASSHWESRVLQGSIMTAALGDSATVRIDPITLAAFQDTGWYDVDLSRAQSLVWGNGEGSAFGSTSMCNTSSFFCNDRELGCHFLHLHKGACQTDQYLEGCRMYKPLSNGSECFKKESKKWSDKKEEAGEIFDSGSRCFFSSLVRQSSDRVVPSSVLVEGRCYRHRCTGPNRYQIQVSGSGWLDCPAGGSTKVTEYQGSVFCPDRRLCLSSDVFLASADSNPTSSSIRGSSDGSVQDGTWFPLRPPSVTSGLCFTAAVVVVVYFLAALVWSYKKRPCRVRVNAVAPTDHRHREETS